MTFLPNSLPIFPLDGILLLPRGNLPLNIFEPRYINMIDYALKTDRMIGMVQTASASTEENTIISPDPKAPAVSKIGCAGRITLFSESEDGRYVITLTGISRFKIKHEIEDNHLFRIVDLSWDEFASDLSPIEGEGVNRDAVISTLRRYLDANKLETDWESIERADNESLINALAMMSPFGDREKQALLEADTLAQRAELLIAMTEISLNQNSDESSHKLQ